LFLSRIELDLGLNATRRALSSPQILHAAVEGCFPDLEIKYRKLWRLDNLQGKLFLLLVSHKEPDFSLFTQQFSSKDMKSETKKYQPFINKIQTGGNYRFRLRANPVHNVSTENRTRGKVYAHVTVAQKQDWLVKKAATNGFKLNEDWFSVVETDYMRFKRDKKEEPIVISTAVFEGKLEVIDSSIFAQTLIQGIGRAKAYGCGLLTVAEIQ